MALPEAMHAGKGVPPSPQWASHSLQPTPQVGHGNESPLLPGSAGVYLVRWRKGACKGGGCKGAYRTRVRGCKGV